MGQLRISCVHNFCFSITIDMVLLLVLCHSLHPMLSRQFPPFLFLRASNRFLSLKTVMLDEAVGLTSAQRVSLALGCWLAQGVVIPPPFPFNWFRPTLWRCNGYCLMVTGNKMSHKDQESSRSRSFPFCLDMWISASLHNRALTKGQRLGIKHTNDDEDQYIHEAALSGHWYVWPSSFFSWQWLSRISGRGSRLSLPLEPL